MPPTRPKMLNPVLAIYAPTRYHVIVSFISSFKLHCTISTAHVQFSTEMKKKQGGSSAQKKGLLRLKSMMKIYIIHFIFVILFGNALF